MDRVDLGRAFHGIADPEAVFEQAVDVFAEFGPGWLAHGVGDPKTFTLTAFASNFPDSFLADLGTADLRQTDYFARHCLEHDTLLVTNTAEREDPVRAPLNAVLSRNGVHAVASQPVPVTGAFGGVTYFAHDVELAVRLRAPRAAERFSMAAMLFNAAFQPGRFTLLPTPDSPVRKNFLLSPREHEALRHLAGGMRTEGIARQMGVSEAAVKKHLLMARGKLGARTREQAVAEAISRRIITP